MLSSQEVTETVVTVQEDEQKVRAILVALQSAGTDNEAFERSVRELAGLAEACLLDPVSLITQRLKHPVHATYIGIGKLEELKAECYALSADLVVFDRSLTPVQIRNLSRILDREVIDRTDLILRIFSDRARTKEARLQVEYARLSYLLPRLVGMRENLSRQGGAGGFMSARGAGETQLELDRRKILNRQARLRKELKDVERVRTTQRTSRLKGSLPRVGLVGYTNAGKSTLMNRLLSMSSGDAKTVFTENMLFATLDTTVRRIDIRGEYLFLLSDTVGFISDLPASLVEAFRSTLAEAADSDLLLEVVDCTDEDREAQSAVTAQTLKEIGAGGLPRIRVMNKADAEGSLHPAGYVLRRAPSGGNDEVYISAKTGEGVDTLLSLIMDCLAGIRSRRITLPVSIR